MLVFGDQPREAAPQEMLAALAGALHVIATMPPGLARHALLAEALVAAGELAQGLADHGFAARGHDAANALDAAAMRLVMGLAGALGRSWDSGFADMGALPAAALAFPLPDRIAPRRAEGFAFYALYPEAYHLAARSSDLGPQTRVIGLRSIGLPLAAMVATSLAAAPPAALRPVGHPFSRTLSLAPDLAAQLVADADAYAIVDEGPGLSGSSMGAVADFLEAEGVARSRLHFFPGHAGPPGPQASERHAARWRQVRRHVTPLETMLPGERLAAWVADLVGPATAPPIEISGGAWRELSASQSRPPVQPQQERRKFLLEAGGSRWLLKFAGLGDAGRGKAGMARSLAAAGFSPATAGFRHGFLIESWLDGGKAPDAWPLQPVARYLGFRRRQFAGGPGASAAELWSMACHNASEGLGDVAARRLAACQPALSQLDSVIRRCAIDGRMHRWEWLRLPTESLLKTDAVDHHAAHDLVGCQDIAWDIVGAAMELGLPLRGLAAEVAAEGGPIDAQLLDFYVPCYLAFQLGSWTMAAAGSHGEDHQGQQREASRYAAMLRRVIEGGGVDFTSVLD